MTAGLWGVAAGLWGVAAGLWRCRGGLASMGCWLACFTWNFGRGR